MPSWKAETPLAGRGLWLGVCDWRWHGDVEGNDADVLYIAQQNANHYVPLLPLGEQALSGESLSSAPGHGQQSVFV